MTGSSHDVLWGSQGSSHDVLWEIPIVRLEILSLLEKGSYRKSTHLPDGVRLLQPIFLDPKKDGGLRLILDLRRLNFSLGVSRCQDAGVEVHLVSSPDRRSVHDNQSEMCIFIL